MRQGMIEAIKYPLFSDHITTFMAETLFKTSDIFFLSLFFIILFYTLYFILFISFHFIYFVLFLFIFCLFFVYFFSHFLVTFFVVVIFCYFSLCCTHLLLQIFI